MIKIKTSSEIKKMIVAGKILAQVKKIIYDKIVPGITTEELDKIAYQEIIKRKAKPAFLGYNGFPKTLCISINEELIHGIPRKDKVIKEGDIVSVDAGVIWKKYYSDSAFTKGVGKIKAHHKKVIEVAKQAFYAGLNAIKPGARLGDVEFAIGEYIRKAGFFTPSEFSGHGIGRKLHEPPNVNNSGIKNTGPLLKDGMVIAIEPMILQDNNQIEYLDDGWTIVSRNRKVTAHYEHTVLIKDGKPIILTGGI